MTMLTSRRLINHIALNLLISGLLLSIKWNLDKYNEGILFYFKLILAAPSFFIIMLIMGPNYAMHFTIYKLELSVSFGLYSIMVGIMQLLYLVYSNKKKL